MPDARKAAFDDGICSPLPLIAFLLNPEQRVVPFPELLSITIDLREAPFTNSQFERLVQTRMLPPSYAQSNLLPFSEVVPVLSILRDEIHSTEETEWMRGDLFKKARRKEFPLPVMRSRLMALTWADVPNADAILEEVLVPLQAAF